MHPQIPTSERFFGEKLRHVGGGLSKEKKGGLERRSGEIRGHQFQWQFEVWGCRENSERGQGRFRYTEKKEGGWRLGKDLTGGAHL
jgi:hypothetical protein